MPTAKKRTSGVSRPIRPGDGDARHGTENGYTNCRCDCEACTEAHRVAHAEYMRTHPEQMEKARRRSRERYARMKAKKNRV